MATTIHASPSINKTAVVVVFRIRPGCESSRENGFCVMASSSKWIAKIRRMHGVDMPPVAVAAATVREVDMSQVLGKKAGSNGCRDDVTTTCIPILDSVHPSLGKEENNKVLTKKWYHSGSFFFFIFIQTWNWSLRGRITTAVYDASSHRPCSWPTMRIKHSSSDSSYVYKQDSKVSSSSCLKKKSKLAPILLLLTKGQERTDVRIISFF